jgi:AcrR family transcriptional regulator
MSPDRVSARRTRAELLDAATATLVQTGYAQLSLRAVADRAGVPVSQIHYHFGGKEGLLLGVLEEQNAQLLQRQRGMYGSEMPLWKRWEQACDYLEDDLASGYVRVLQELIAVGWSDANVAAMVRVQLEGWAELLTSVGEEARRTFGVGALSARNIAVLIGSAFLGAEELELLGMGDTLEVIDALRSVGDLLRQAEEGR